LKGWDYAKDGWYFVTICTGARKCFFGDIAAGEMQLSAEGRVAKNNWREITNYFPDFQLDEFIIMPNHIHGILVIHQEKDSLNRCRDAINRVSTDDMGNHGGVTKQYNPMLSKDSLSKVIRWYKGRCKYEIGKINPDFSWQPRFDDRIIRDENSLSQVRHYIVSNPLKWQDDSENPANLSPKESKDKF
jgi:REP element-mobilizing transposase RayT